MEIIFSLIRDWSGTSTRQIILLFPGPEAGKEDRYNRFLYPRDGAFVGGPWIFGHRKVTVNCFNVHTYTDRKKAVRLGQNPKLSDVRDFGSPPVQNRNEWFWNPPAGLAQHKELIGCSSPNQEVDLRSLNYNETITTKYISIGHHCCSWIATLSFRLQSQVDSSWQLRQWYTSSYLRKTQRLAGTLWQQMKWVKASATQHATFCYSHANPSPKQWQPWKSGSTGAGQPVGFDHVTPCYLKNSTLVSCC